MDLLNSSTMLQEFLEILVQISFNWYVFNILYTVINYCSKI